MKQFQFRLDSVLRLREARLEMERRKLQQLAAEQQRIRQELARLGQERVQAGRFLQQAAGGVGAAELRALSGFLLGWRARGTALSDRLEVVGRVAGEQRQRVLAAERDARLLTKMRERKLEEWKREMDRELETVAQDAWTSAHYRERNLAGSKETR
jgi:flagellar FliJ protein